MTASTCRRELKSPAVTARWVGVASPLALECGYALLEIGSPTGTAAYWVTRLAERGRVQGYRLRHEDTGKVYDIDVTFGGAEHGECDCPAATWNGAAYRCKHSSGLALGLRALAAASKAA